MSKSLSQRAIGAFSCSVAICAVLVLNAPSVLAETVSRSVDVDAAPSEVWKTIGPFCAIKNWLPPVGTCTQDGKAPPTRTLVTKDGKATFVELQTHRSDADYSYSYSFLSTPLPVTNYSSTIKVMPQTGGRSTVIWSSSFTPDEGKAEAASDALAGIYEAGLTSIRAQFAN